MTFHPGTFRSRIMMPRTPYFYARLSRIRSDVFVRKDRNFIEVISKMAGKKSQ